VDFGVTENVGSGRHFNVGPLHPRRRAAAARAEIKKAGRSPLFFDVRGAYFDAAGAADELAAEESSDLRVFLAFLAFFACFSIFGVSAEGVLGSGD
jgi:hypothetical protein